MAIKCHIIYTTVVLNPQQPFLVMADSLEPTMFVCQLDARECQDVTDRRLVSEWLPLSLG